jgi:hypothetical protein
MSITGTGDIGVVWRAIADIAVANESKADADGFGRPTFSATGTWGYVGSGDLTTAAASLSGTGVLTYEGVGTLTTAAASLSGTGDVPFIGVGNLTTAPAILVGTGEETYAGYGQFFPGPASLTGTGAISVSGVGNIVFAPATLAGTARQNKPKGGHSRKQMREYEDFVHMGQVIKGELLGHLAPNELQSPEHLPQPLNLTVETREPDVLPDIQPDLTVRVAPLPPMTLPEVRIKPTIVGAGALTTDGMNLGGLVRNATVNGYSDLLTDPATLQGRGTTDIYYAQRRQEDALIEQFLLQLVA